MNQRKNKTTVRCGTTAVEVAICLPVLFMVLFGSYEFARANMMRHSTEAAAYEGARIGVLPGTTRQKIVDACSRILSTVGVNDFSVNVSPANFDNNTETVTVEIDVPYRGNCVVPTFFVQDPNFHGRCEMRREVF